MSGANPDQNLLFGILALQMDFIDRDQLVEAMNAWVLEKSTPLSEILTTSGVLAPADRNLLESMVARHVQLHDGDAEKSLASVSSIGSIRDQLKTITDPDVETSLARISTARTDTDLHATLPLGTDRASKSSRQRFRILRPHAEGGLGKVSVALDEELNREVALKEIHELHAGNPDSRTRFVMEAEITGGLEHPGIVPVYGLGQYEDGRPFYAMRFIRGDTLKDAIEEFYSQGVDSRRRFHEGDGAVQFRKLLRRFVDVCNAVEYAHSRGVLHRDLKPGNVMLGKYGETLVVDWGMAKAVGRAETKSRFDEVTLRPSWDSGTAPTQFGSAMGTPGYMSPEQAAGRLDQIGPASDIYNLGATLYCLLTGHAPFTDSNMGLVLSKIQGGKFARPSEVKRAVPKALEAICVKAMALKPEDRYESAGALAEDIERWLADEPVSAYREPLFVRARRFIKRHQVAVAGTIAGILVALVALVAVTGVVVATNRRLAAANVAIRMQELTWMDEKATDHMSDGYPERAIPLLERSLQLQNELLGANHPSTHSLTERLALACEAAGQPEKAIPLFERTLARQRKQLGPEHQATLHTMNRLATAYRVAGERERAIALFEQTLQHRKKKLGPHHPHTLDSMNDLAITYRQAEEMEKAISLLEEAVRMKREEIGQDHSSTLRSVDGLAEVYEEIGEFSKANELYRDLVRIERQREKPEPLRLSGSLAALGRCLTKQGSYDESVEVLRECLQIRRERDPANWLMSNAQSMLGAALAGQKGFQEAEPLLLDGYNGLVERQERIPALIRNERITEALQRLVNLYQAWDKPSEASKWRDELQQRKERPQPSTVAKPD